METAMSDRAPWDLSPEAEDFIESAKVLAEPYEEDIAALRAEVARLREREAALISAKDGDLDDLRDERDYLRAARDPALGRCQQPMQCHNASDHAGDHEAREPQVAAS
jgi:hypothetical protein